MTSWKTNGNTALLLRGLVTQSYGYDNLNRLKTSSMSGMGKTFALGGNDNGMNYDDNGNIKNMTRTWNGVNADVLSYSYKPNSNQIDKVEDSGNATFFENKNAGSTDYQYDNNGNTTQDKNKGITNIDYNHLNLTKQVLVNGKVIDYLYTATGQKLQANFGAGRKYDYLAAGVFANDTLEYIPTAEGRYTKTNQYEYFLKDHLGNLRTSCGCNAKGLVVLQENHYDPWGMDLPELGINGLVRDKFTGKEAQAETGYIDFGARQYDPTVPHFLTVDPLAELDFNFSPYVYVGNNPLSFTDPTGMKRVNIEDSDNYYDDETWELTIVGKKTQSDPVFGNLWVSYDQNYQRTGHASPMDKEFQGGSKAAAAFFAAPLIAIVAAEAGAGALISQGASYLTRANMLAAGRWALKSRVGRSLVDASWKEAAWFNGFMNLGGKSIENALKGELKLDILGLGADIFGTNLGSAIVGGVGEIGYDFQKKKPYIELNNSKTGLGKFITGVGLGKMGDNFYNIADNIGGAGATSVKIIYGEISKLFEENANNKIDKTYGDKK